MLEKDSLHYANKVVNNIIDTSFELPAFPNKGRIIPELENENLREVFVYSYRLMYEIRENDIYVLAVIHGSRNFTRELVGL